MAKEDFGTNLACFAAGALLGAGAAMLLTPQTGKDARGKIKEQAKGSGKKLAESGRELFDRGRHLYERGRELAEDAAEMFERGRQLAEKKIEDL